MISTILFLSFTSSTATFAKPPAFARCASWLMLFASPASYLCRHDSLPHILADTQPELDVFARIVVSDKTLWQQVFR